MLKVRIIPCLDVIGCNVVKGVQFKDLKVVGDILELAKTYSDTGADELVFYDISASVERRSVDTMWIERLAKVIQIPFCVAGGIRSMEDAEEILSAGADKISINSHALENPNLINALSKRFGKQCVVVSIDSFQSDDRYLVYQYAGDQSKIRNTSKYTLEWAKEVQDRGAGEIVLNCMNQDGMRRGFDIDQISTLTQEIAIPVIASGGAGSIDDFSQLFVNTAATGALAASVFHNRLISISTLKNQLFSQGIEVRL
jgi:cyclase